MGQWKGRKGITSSVSFADTFPDWRGRLRGDAQKTPILKKVRNEVTQQAEVNGSAVHFQSRRGPSTAMRESWPVGPERIN